MNIQEQNAPLKAMMEAKGCKLFTDVMDRFTHFIDDKGNYVPYPVGYITGPSKSTSRDKNGELYYSVQGKDGWLQKCFPMKDYKLGEQWAIKTAKEILDKP